MNPHPFPYSSAASNQAVANICLTSVNCVLSGEKRGEGGLICKNRQMTEDSVEEGTAFMGALSTG